MEEGNAATSKKVFFTNRTTAEAIAMRRPSFIEAAREGESRRPPTRNHRRLAQTQVTAANAQSILKGVDITRTERTPLTEIVIANIARNRTGHIRAALRFFKVDASAIVDIHWLSKKVMVAVSPRAKAEALIAQFAQVPDARVLDAFDPLDTSEIRQDPQFAGLTEAQLLEECAKRAKERYDRAIAALPNNRSGTRAYYEYRKACVENEKARRKDAERARALVTDFNTSLDAEMAPPPLSPITLAAINESAY